MRARYGEGWSRYGAGLEHGVGWFLILATTPVLFVVVLNQRRWKLTAFYLVHFAVAVFFDRIANPVSVDLFKSDISAPPFFSYQLIWWSILVLVAACALVHRRQYGFEPAPDRRLLVVLPFTIAALAFYYFFFHPNRKEERSLARSAEIDASNERARISNEEKRAEAWRDAKPDPILQNRANSQLHATLRGHLTSNKTGDWDIWLDIDGDKLIQTVPPFVCSSKRGFPVVPEKNELQHVVVNLGVAGDFTVWLEFSASENVKLFARSKKCEVSREIVFDALPTTPKTRLGFARHRLKRGAWKLHSSEKMSSGKFEVVFSPNSVGITEAEGSVIDPVELPELNNPGCVDTAIYLYPSAPMHVAWEQNLYPDCADIEPADRNRRSYVWRRSQEGTFEPLVRRDRWAGVSLWRTGEVEWNLERALDGYKESVRWESAECGHEVVKLDRAYRWSARTRDGTTVKLDTVHNSDSVEGPCTKKPFAK